MPLIAAAAAVALTVTCPVTAFAASSSQTIENKGETIEGTPSTYRNGTVDGGETEIGTQDIDVQARVIGGSEIVYNVTIEWGAMQFEYDYGSTWNPTTHSYGANGQSNGGWITSPYVDGSNSAGAPVNNGIIITNDSNFPVTADFSYDTTNGATLNAVPTAQGSVVGIFGDSNNELTSLLSKGAGNGIPTGNTSPTSMILEMNHSQLTAAGTFYYYKNSQGGSNTGNKYFALSGKPDTGGPTAFTKVGTIKVTLKPATGATKETN